MPYFVKIISAVDSDKVGLKFPLGEGQTLVGRVSPPSKIKLEGIKVSKKHCSFIIEKGILKILDHNSSNGVYVNGKKVTTVDLKEKDRIVIGEFTLEVTVK